MNPLLGSLAVAALALVAAAGVVAGFRRRDPVPLEPPADPLEDRRLALLRSLADLEEAHGSGLLDDGRYDRLRRETEARVARVLRALEARSRPAAAPVGPAVRAEVATAPTRQAGRVPAWAVGTLLVATVLAVAVAGLARDAEPVGTTAAGPTRSDDPFAFFEQRVRDHPNDLAARLDLAHRYLDAGRAEDAMEQYAAALELDPDDAEAHAHVAILLYPSDPERALEQVDRALDTAPTYPEALFVRGVILLEGLDRPADAVRSFEAYLEAAPFGSERGTAQRLIERAEAAIQEGATADS